MQSERYSDFMLPVGSQFVTTAFMVVVLVVRFYQSFSCFSFTFYMNISPCFSNWSCNSLISLFYKGSISSCCCVLLPLYFASLNPSPLLFSLMSEELSRFIILFILFIYFKGSIFSQRKKMKRYSIFKLQQKEMEFCDVFSNSILEILEKD